MGEPTAHPPNAYTAIIERVYDHNADTRSLFLRLPPTRRLNFQPGQFLSFSLPVAGKMLTRPYSIASDPVEDAPLEICFNLVPGGLGSSYLFDCQVGDCLNFTGPWGTFVLDHPLSVECVFLAEGTGIAPIRPMIRQMLALPRPVPMRLLYSARRESDLLYRQELETWARDYPSFHFEPILSEPPSSWLERQGTWVEHAERRYLLADQDRSRHFFICGVGSSVTQLRDLLRGAGYERRAVHYEKW
ncbi:MAG: FAD-dependent oxidoreductase [Deltaproteobacteria bacterium]|nr:FAD-dependent oxidoreductase [Deltaproteobacteria bacterium]